MTREQKREELMESKRKAWWLLGLPLLICLPCLLPVLAVAILAAGGAGALGSFLSGIGGLLALAAAVLLLASATAVYLWSKRRGRRASLRVLPRND